MAKTPPKVTSNQRNRELIFALSLIVFLSILACGGRVFEELHVYSSTPGSIEQFYNSTTDEILSDNVWVFRSDGTFDAVIASGDEQYRLSGKYEGDSTGDGFYFFLDTTGDEKFDDGEVLLSEDNAFIEWEGEGQIQRYELVE